MTNLEYRFLKAIKSNKLEIVKECINQNVDINVQDKFKNTALILSSSNGSLGIVKYLIDQGADLNVKNNDMNTALILGSRKGSLDIVKLLVKNGAVIDNKNKHNCTALIESSRNGYLEVVKYLIVQGADVEVVSDAGENRALFYSFISGHLEVVNYLIFNIYDYNQFEKIYNHLEIEQKHILFKHFMNNRELLEKVNPRKMKGFISDINKWKNNL